MSLMLESELSFVGQKNGKIKKTYISVGIVYNWQNEETYIGVGIVGPR